MADHKSTGKTLSELFVGGKIITFFQRFLMASDSENKTDKRDS